MQAFVVERPGHAHVTNVPRPECGTHDVEIRVDAAALNHEDLFAIEGTTGPGLRGMTYPTVPGCDVAGTVSRVGEGVDRSLLGKRVLVYPSIGCGTCHYCHRGEHTMCADYMGWGEQTWGGLAEYARVPATNLVPIPNEIGAVSAAAFPVAYTTAWNAVITRGELRSWETVLICGIGGGVALAALDIARMVGARVLVTSSSNDKISRAITMGAEAGVNYSETDPVSWLASGVCPQGADLVIDSSGAASWRSSINCLAPGGRMCVYGATTGDSPAISIRELYQTQRQIRGAPMGSRADFDLAWHAAGAGLLRPVVDSTWPLRDMDAALARLDHGLQFGKIVIQPAK